MKSIFKGQNIKKTYKFDRYSSSNEIPYVEKKSEVINYETILETNLDTPPLQQGDQFYLIKEDKVIYIEKALQGTDNVMVYLTNVILHTEEEYEESLKLAINKREQYLKEKEERDKQQEIEYYKREYRDATFLKKLFMKKPE